jgi:hypothetical protein
MRCSTRSIHFRLSSFKQKSVMDGDALARLPHEDLRQQGAEKGQDDGGEVFVISYKAFDLFFHGIQPSCSESDRLPAIR